MNKLISILGALAVASFLTFLTASGCSVPPAPTTQQVSSVGGEIEGARKRVDDVIHNPKSTDEDVALAKSASDRIGELEAELARLIAMMNEPAVPPQVEPVVDPLLGLIPEPYKTFTGLGLAAVGGVAAVMQRKKWGGAFTALIKSIERAKAGNPLLAQAFDASKNAIKANLDSDVQVMVEKVRVESGKVSFVPPAPPGTPTTPG